MKLSTVTEETFSSVASVLRSYTCLPYFFHPSLDRAALWAHWERGLREGLAQGSLALLVFEEGGACAAVVGVERMDWDCAHFGRTIGRIFPFFLPGAEGGEVARRVGKLVPLLKKWLGEHGYDYVTVATEVPDYALTIALQENGFLLIDCWVTWTLDLSRQPVTLLRNQDILFRPFDKTNPREYEEVMALSMESFRTNRDRYHNDPLIDNALADDLYRQWTHNSLLVYDRTAFVADMGDYIGGYSTVKVHHQANAVLQRPVGEVELCAVSPRVRGRGLSTDLFKMGFFWMRDEAGVVLIHEKTQVNNHAMQNNFKTLGLRLVRTSYVLRLAM
jgi:RimJ/RimL family protein N-acetyltransferase